MSGSTGEWLVGEPVQRPPGGTDIRHTHVGDGSCVRELRPHIGERHLGMTSKPGDHTPEPKRRV